MSESLKTEDAVSLENNAVSGGRIWEPSKDAGWSAKQKKLFIFKYYIFPPFTLLAVVMYIFSGGILIGNKVGINETSTESVPQSVTVNDFLGYAPIEIVLLGFFLLFAILVLVLFSSERLWTSLILAAMIIAPSAASVAINGKTADINAWAAQYGYKFDAIIIPPNFESRMATNLQTGEREEVHFSKVDGNIILDAEPITTTVAEPSLVAIKVIIEDGKPVLVDKETGDKYNLEKQTD